MLHEPNQSPDIKNIKGKHFYANPGHILNLKISTTVIESTEDFDVMHLNSRGCDKNFGYGEIDCIMKKIDEKAKSECGCSPWYVTREGIEECDTLGTICYEKMIENGIEHLGLHNSCYEACNYVKYSMILNEDLPMTDCCFPKNGYDSDNRLLSFDRYGEEFINYLYKSERLYRYLGHFLGKKPFLKPKLEKLSLIHINFEESRVWTVTKDAKITTSDMIGNIGGTLGVFIGFSFLGLLDTLIEVAQYLLRKEWTLSNQNKEDLSQ